LKANPDRVCWRELYQNPNPDVLTMINRNLIFEWFFIAVNPNIFEYDYKAMARPFTEELMAKCFHPKNLDKFEAWGF